MFLIIAFQPAHNDKTAHPEVARLMKELIKSRKQLKGQLQNHADRHGCCKMCPLSFLCKSRDVIHIYSNTSKRRAFKIFFISRDITSHIDCL